MTDDDHLLHNAFTGVAWRPTYFLQFGMSNFLRWNPQNHTAPTNSINNRNPLMSAQNQPQVLFVLLCGSDSFLLKMIDG